MSLGSWCVFNDIRFGSIYRFEYIGVGIIDTSLAVVTVFRVS